VRSARRQFVSNPKELPPEAAGPATNRHLVALWHFGDKASRRRLKPSQYPLKGVTGRQGHECRSTEKLKTDEIVDLELLDQTSLAAVQLRLAITSGGTSFSSESNRQKRKPN
jgi:hypothetical protein